MARRLGDNEGDEDEAIRVVARVRPLTEAEQGEGHAVALSCLEDNRTVQIDPLSSEDGKRVAQSYSLDASVPPDASQGVFFDRCGIKPLLHSVLDGFAATCFAYGQTGSGKTYSLIGPESATDKLDQRSSEQDGLLSRAVKFLFSEIKRREDVEHAVEVSYCEIYNEQVRDLLGKSSGGGGAALPVRYNPHQGFFVEGLTTVRCQSKAEVMRCFCQGFKTTRVGAHDMNQRSNRSHCMFNVHVHIKVIDEEQGAPQVAHGRMCFVDLAGSERVRDTQAVGKTLAESGQINKSLFVLGKVISALTTKARKGAAETRVPYRDSTLTRLLMPSLGGTCKTLMVTCCSSSSAHVNESLRSLQFASRAKHIRNKPVVVLDPKESLIQELKKEIAKLRRHNAHLQQNLKDTIATRSSLPLLGGCEDAEAELQAGALARAGKQRVQHRDEKVPPAGPCGREARDGPSGRARQLNQHGGEQRRAAGEDGCDGHDGYEGSVGGEDVGAGESIHAHKLARKTRYVLSEHRRRAQEIRSRQHGGLGDGHSLKRDQGSGWQEEQRSGSCWEVETERDARLMEIETERDARLMEELRELMREYVEHQGRAAGPGTDAPVREGWGTEEGGSRGGQMAGGNSPASSFEEYDGWEEWEVDDENHDLLNLPSDDEDEHVDVLDVWSADKADALEEMRSLERELAKETGTKPSYLNVRQSLAEGPRVRPRDHLGGQRVRPATAAARPCLDNRGREVVSGQLDRGAEERGASAEWLSERELGASQGLARERVVFQGGRGREGGVAGRRPRPMTVGIDGRGSSGLVSRAGEGDSRDGAGEVVTGAQRMQRAREEAIRATLENINGWGT